MTRRIVQITDSHLLADPAAQLKGVCARDSFHAVIKALAAELASADLLVVTGDLTHDERLESYVALRELLADWLPRLRVVPGNHDDRALIRQAFSPTEDGPAGRIVFAEDLGAWRTIGLDTHVSGSVGGQLGVEQRTWLASQLDAFPTSPTMLFLHHPPVTTNSTWLDAVGLADAPELWELLASRRHVKAVVAGHVHQEMTVLQQGVVVLTTPSTGVQFVPETTVLEVDPVGPAYRVLDLYDDGRFTTRVQRVSV